MIDRWRGRVAGLAIVVALGIGSALALTGAAGPRASPAPAPGAERWQLVVRDERSEILLRAPLPDGTFVLRYRNSIYGSLAEERFAITPDGGIALVDLGAEQAAVLGEYYAVSARPRPAPPGRVMHWVASPATTLTLDELVVAATAHGQRTLIVEGRDPVPLWRLVDAVSPTVTFEAEERG